MIKKTVAFPDRLPLHFRDALPNDLPQIVEIYNSVVAGRMVTADTEPVTVESRQLWFDQHEARRRPLWIAMQQSETVGWVSFQSFYGRPAYQPTAEISIYLDEKYRGKGLGAECLQYAMDTCEKLAIKTLLAYVFAHNTASLNLFKKKGFTEWGVFPRIALIDGIEKTVIILGKRINA